MVSSQHGQLTPTECSQTATQARRGSDARVRAGSRHHRIRSEQRVAQFWEPSWREGNGLSSNGRHADAICGPEARFGVLYWQKMLDMLKMAPDRRLSPDS
jgi:hypothetical protein